MLQQQQQQQAKIRSLALHGHVGFDSLPDQLVNKSIAEGFTFNVLCIGLQHIFKNIVHKNV